MFWSLFTQSPRKNVKMSVNQSLDTTMLQYKNNKITKLCKPEHRKTYMRRKICSLPAPKSPLLFGQFPQENAKKP